MTNLEALVGSGTNTTSGTTASFVDYLASLGAKIVGGVAEFKGVSTETGITTKDRVTSEYYCMYTENGIAKTSPGKCSVVPSSGSSDVDIIPPVITLMGDNPALINKGIPFSDPGANALDAISGIIIVDTFGAEIDTSIVGTSTITYVARDGAGNTATSTRTVVVTDSGSLVVPPIVENPATTTASTTEN
jgi:hypothetical protein